MNTVVITTINPPTEAIEAWARRTDLARVIVGDRKTPRDWSYPGCEYIGCDNVTSPLDVRSHYCRKNLGYIAAIKAGATAIIDTDDDNIPKYGWKFPESRGGYNTLSHAGFINIYSFFLPPAHPPVWPRGFPLEELRQPKPYRVKHDAADVAIWQGLADGSPDVDAVFRLTRGEDPITFAKINPLVLTAGTLCPFNSQNTVFTPPAYPLLYLPKVSFRFTDILRSYVAQPILWRAGYRLGFTEATVVQKRNAHNLLDDFESEIPMYLHARRIVDIVKQAVSQSTDVRINLLRAYQALADHALVDECEPARVKAWLEELPQA